MRFGTKPYHPVVTRAAATRSTPAEGEAGEPGIGRAARRYHRRDVRPHPRRRRARRASRSARPRRGRARAPREPNSTTSSTSTPCSRRSIPTPSRRRPRRSSSTNILRDDVVTRRSAASGSWRTRRPPTANSSSCRRSSAARERAAAASDRPDRDVGPRDGRRPPRGAVLARDLAGAHLAAPGVRTVPSTHGSMLDPEGARAQAEEADRRLAQLRREPDVRGHVARSGPPAARRPGRPQGPRLGRGRAGHRRLAHPRGLRRAVRRPRHRAPARRGRRDPRQDEHGRVRDGLVDRELRIRPDGQPLGPRSRPGRLERRLGRGRGGAPRPARDRHRHGRLDPPAGGAVRRSSA